MHRKQRLTFYPIKVLIYIFMGIFVLYITDKFYEYIAHSDRIEEFAELLSIEFNEVLSSMFMLLALFCFLAIICQVAIHIHKR